MDQTDAQTNLLKHVETKINQGRFSEAFSTFYDGLGNIRRHSSTEDWKEFISQYRQHPVSHFFLQEPLSRRAFERPRGYAGDPVMLDLQYDFEKVVPLLDEGKQIGIPELLNYELNRIGHASHAVRTRRRLLSLKIDETSERVTKPYILSLACGNLREALDSFAIKNRSIGKFVAIDNDKEALAVVAETLQDLGETIQATFLDIIKKKVSLPQFDFIYSPGLYDYLPEPIAKKLTNSLFQMLNPGGRLLIANYLPDSPSIGYMEAVMDWWLIYRDKEQMKELIEDIPHDQIKNVDLYTDRNLVIYFMEIEKAG